MIDFIKNTDKIMCASPTLITTPLPLIIIMQAIAWIMDLDLLGEWHILYIMYY